MRRSLLGQHRALRAITFTCLITLGSCQAPKITSIDVGAESGGPVRVDAPAKITINIDRRGQTIRDQWLELERLSPPGSRISRSLSDGPSTGDERSYFDVIAAGEPAVAFVQGQRWRAIAGIRYPWLDSETTRTGYSEFDILEPAACFAFLDAAASPRWTLHGLFPGANSQSIADLAMAVYPDENFPAPQVGDHAIGFQISNFPATGWQGEDYWSAEFLSPPLYGQGSVTTWAGVRRFEFQARTDAVGITLQPIITLLDTNGQPRVFAMIDANQQRVFLSVQDDDQWHPYTADFSSLSLPQGHVMSVSLRAFGRVNELDVNDGKRVMIDHVCKR